MIRQGYTLQEARRNKAWLPSVTNVITILLTILSGLYFHPCDLLFLPMAYVSLEVCTIWCPSPILPMPLPTFPLATIYGTVSLFCCCYCLFTCFVFWSPRINEIVWYLSSFVLFHRRSTLQVHLKN